MAFPVGSGHTVYGSRTIDQNQNINQAPTGPLGQLKQVFSRSDQLFVPDTHGNFIATGVTKSDLSKLKQADLNTPGTIKFLHTETAKKILFAAGLPGPHIAAMRPDHAIRLATYLSTNGPHAASLLALEHAVAAGTMNRVVTDQVARQLGANPELADKLVQMGGEELAGNRPPGTTAFTAQAVSEDTRIADMRGYPRARELPTAATLGFQPKLHVKLAAADYQGLKALIQQHQTQFGSFPDVHFDDAHCRVDFGYGIEELEATERGRQANPLANGPPIPLPISYYLTRSPDYQGGQQPSHTDVLSCFGNPSYLEQRQAGRLDAIAGIHVSFHDFDYNNYDANVTPAINNQIQQFANNNTNANLIDDILTTQGFPGISLSESHTELEGKEFITAQMANLFNAGVRVVGLEHLNVSGLQDKIDAFMATPHGTPMPHSLVATLRGLAAARSATVNVPPNDSLVNLIMAAKNHPPMQVVAINAENLRPSDAGNDRMAIRDGTMNAVGKENLDARLQSAVTGTLPNPKFVLLAGRAHNKAHAGLVNNGVPGFSQVYGVPTLHIDPKGNPNNADFPITVEGDAPLNRNGNAPPSPPLAPPRFMRGAATGKGDAIYLTVGEWAKDALESRLFNAPPTEQEAIKDLLHFGYFDRGNTTVQSRLDIRTALALGLARGASVDDLRFLRQVMEGADPAKFAGVIAKLNQEGVLVGEALSGLLDPSAANARETFEALRPLLTFGEADLTKADSNVFADGNIALKRDVNGDLQFANVDLAFAALQAPTKHLDPTKLAEITQLFRDLTSTSYSNGTVLLDFMEHFRTLNAHPPGATMSQALSSFAPDGRGAMAKYNRADCIGVAEEMVHQLKLMGIDAYIAGVNNAGLTTQKSGWPGKPGKKPDTYDPVGIQHATGMVTHAEIIVPYLDDQGNAKVLAFTPGGGNLDQYINTSDFNPTSITQGLNARFGNKAALRLRVDPDGGSLGGAEMQKSQLAFRTNINLFNNDPTQNLAADKDVSYVNLLEGRISLSTALSDKLRQTTDFPFDVGNGELSFNYRDALNNPNAVITVTDFGRQHQLTKLDALALFLDIVAEHSGQGDAFLNNMVTLLVNDREYCDAVLAPDIAGLAKFNVPRKDAIANQPPPTDLVRRPQWDGLMQQAKTAIDNGQYDQAVGFYNQAAAL